MDGDVGTGSESGWGVRLNRAHAKATGSSRSNVALPSKGITFAGTAERLRIRMSDTAILRNMQDNAATFEGWALALKAWCKVAAVELDWEEPSSCTPHYERFLYRADRFKEMFPDWFSIAHPERLIKRRAVSGSILNVAGDRLALAIATHQPRMAGLPLSEAEIEKQMTVGTSLTRMFGICKVDRQFPVGLFDADGGVARGKEIFSGAKSAIDLIGLDHVDGVWIFELKAAGNIGMGMASELLLYAGMLQDAIGGHFRFDKDRAGKGVRIHPQEVKTRKRVEACLLGNSFHPLFDEGRIIGLLNSHKPQGVPIIFRMLKWEHAEKEGEYNVRMIA